jgi:hypothetical protein
MVEDALLLSENYCFNTVSMDYSATLREDAEKYCSKKR